MEKIFYRSTNRKSPLVDFKKALLTGQPPDYGLYIPTYIPEIKIEEIKDLKGKPYFEFAFSILYKFLKNEIDGKKLYEICKKVYNFKVPLVEIEKEKLYILHLDKGPTCSFKDFAARMMAKLMEFFAGKENKKLTVLVATSGDTGGAVANAFYRKENIKVVVLFPFEEVSERQRKQMTTLGDNIIAIGIKGKFDDCQNFVKIAFNDQSLSSLNLTSANSINIGRLLPQIVYYFYGWLNFEKEIVFSVPSGNFGNLMGGVFAKKMGLPVKKFIVAVNENDEFPEFLKTGEYSPVIPSRKCSSNAMNVGHPSNLGRLVDLYGGWIMDERNEKGIVLRYGVLKRKPDMEKLRNDFISFSITDEEVDETIKNFYEKYKVIIEPHTAVGIKSYEKSKIDDLTVVLQTADPAKFPEKIKKILNIEPEIPDTLKEIIEKEENFDVIENDYETFKNYILSRVK